MFFMEKRVSLSRQLTQLAPTLKPSTVLREQPQAEVAIEIARLLKRLAKLYQVPNWDSDSEILLTEWIMDTYQTEQIETVIKCLTKPPIAVKTEGKTWRLTPDVINSWMEREVEREIIEREKQIHNTKVEEREVGEGWTDERLAEWKKVIKNAPGFKPLPKPERPKDEYSTFRILRTEWAKETYNEDGTPKEGALSFDEWILASK